MLLFADHASGHVASLACLKCIIRVDWIIGIGQLIRALPLKAAQAFGQIFIGKKVVSGHPEHRRFGKHGRQRGEQRIDALVVYERAVAAHQRVRQPCQKEPHFNLI